jgi:hypothetical protein
MTFSRIRAIIIVSVLFIVAVLTVVMAIAKDTQTDVDLTERCPEGAVPAYLRLPERSEVKLNVYNGAPRVVGLASKIGNELKNRGFNVVKMADAPGRKTYNEIALIRFGPKAVGAAQEMNAYFLGEAKMEFDIKRKDDVVDVFLGTQFQQLATTTEVNQSIAALGDPALPPGTCEADAQ